MMLPGRSCLALKPPPPPPNLLLARVEGIERLLRDMTREEPAMPFDRDPVRPTPFPIPIRNESARGGADVRERPPRDPIAANMHSALNDLAACHAAMSDIETILHGPRPETDAAVRTEREERVTLGYLADQQTRGLRILVERLLALRAALA